MRYKIHATINYEDRAEYHLYTLKHAPEGRKYMTRYRLTILASVALWCLVSYAMYKLTPMFYLFVTFSVLVGCIWQLLAKVIISRRVRKQLRRSEQKLGVGPTEVIFYEDGFCDIGDDMKTETEYKSIRKAVYYKKTYIFLCADKVAFILPCRSLAGQASIGEFTEFLRSRGIPVENIES